MANAQTQYFEFTTPTGRLVGGNPYEPRTTDSEGRPLEYKNGEKKGQPRVDFYLAIAIPKTPGVTHFAQEKGWGETLWAAGHALGGNAAQRADFAWKVTDGDSTVPNGKQKKPCEQTGYPGCWILHMGNGNPPKLVNQNGSAYLLEVGAVKPGYFVQINAGVSFNGSQTNPGVFINHRAVSLQYHGEIINFGADPASMGFGGGAAPAGAVAIPAGAIGAPAPGAGMPPPPPGAAVPPPAPPAQGVTPPPPPVPGAAMPPPPPAPAAVAPPPVAGFAAAAGAAPAAPAGPVMGPNAAPGVTYAAYLASGWTHDAMVAGGIVMAAAPATPAAPPAPPAPAPVPAGPRMGPNAAAGVTYEAYLASGWTHAAMVAGGIVLA